MTETLIKEWHAAELRMQYPQIGFPRLIMGTPIWGEAYVRRFLDWNLPSILSSREALESFGWELIIYTDAATVQILAEGLQGRVQGQVRVLPQEIMEVMHRGDVAKYWLLAAIHNLLVIEAGRRGAGFHMLVADIAYSQGFFAKLIELGRRYDGIVQQAQTISFNDARPLLEGFRRPDGILAVPARQLGQIGWDHMVGEGKSWTMDGIEDPTLEMPNSHFIHWRGRDSVRIHSAHMSPLWMSPARCATVTPEVGGTLDSELPRYVGRDFYIPSVADDMTYVALDESRSQPTPRTSFEAFKTSLLQLIAYRQDFMEYFRAPCWVPALPIDGFPTDDEVEERFQRLMALIDSSPA